MKPVVIRHGPGHFTERVDPVTRKCTGEPQQFLKAPDGTLSILPRSAWVENPDAIDVAWTRYW